MITKNSHTKNVCNFIVRLWSVYGPFMVLLWGRSGVTIQDFSKFQLRMPRSKAPSSAKRRRLAKVPVKHDATYLAHATWRTQRTQRNTHRTHALIPSVRVNSHALIQSPSIPPQDSALGRFGFTAHRVQDGRVVDISAVYRVPGSPPPASPSWPCAFCPQKFLSSPAATAHTKAKHKFELTKAVDARAAGGFFSLSSRSRSIVDLTSSPSASPSVSSPPMASTSSSPAAPPSVVYYPDMADVDDSDQDGYDSQATQAYGDNDGYESPTFVCTPVARRAAPSVAHVLPPVAVSPRSLAFFDVAQGLEIPFDQPRPGDLTLHAGACYAMNRVRPAFVTDRAAWFQRRRSLAQRRRDAVVDEAVSRGARGELLNFPGSPLFERAGLEDGPDLEQRWAAQCETQRLECTFFEGLWLELDAEMFGEVKVRKCPRVVVISFSLFIHRWLCLSFISLLSF
jgi:hypothetical protein